MEAINTTLETLNSVLTMGGFGANFLESVTKDLPLLEKSLPRAHILINRAEWGRFKNKNLAVLLSQLKDTTYDAEHLLREFHDQALRQKLDNADRNMTGQFLSSCFDHLKSWITGRKTRVEEVRSNLNKALTEMEGALNDMHLNVEAVQHMPETSSVIGVPHVFGRDDVRDRVIDMLSVTTGRDDDRDRVIERLGVPVNRNRAGGPSTSRAKRLKGNATETNCTGNVSVLPIVGIGGVGKTTLAQFIYNDARVKDHFEERMWVCVSDLFDKRRITQEIIKYINRVDYNSHSLDALQVELRDQLMCRKFLLVLDDVWPSANDNWEAFYAPLRHGLAGSMVLVTTRFPMVAHHVTPIKPVQLEGLPEPIFWDFFKNCAFGNELPESYPQLLGIGQRIADRLCGSPLAAKTLGRLLNLELTEHHWTSIQDSELWELPHQENEILPALQLSYLYLPQKLKRCIAFCSMFPKDYSFIRGEIIDIWVAQGLVAAPPGGNMRPEDIGDRYLDDLRSRSFFQANPKFPGQHSYVMHDLIHDMAQSVSVDECFLIQGSSNQRTMPETIRHVSIEVDNEAISRMACINHLNKLHSLRFGTSINREISWFNQLSSVLFLSLKGCKLVKLPEGICDLNHLRYLNISPSSIKELPEKFYRLYSLEVFNASFSKLQTIHAGVTRLVNLRRLELPETPLLALSKISGLGNLSALRSLSYYTVGKEDGRRIGELKGMNHLRYRLCIKFIGNIQNIEEAAEARLVDKKYLKHLELHWQGPGCRKSTGANAVIRANRVLEALRPPPGIKSLEVDRFGGDNFPPSWLNSEDLPDLVSLYLRNCLLTGIDRMQHAGLTSLGLIRCSKLTNVDQFLSPEYLPSIKSIRLEELLELKSLPVHTFGGFGCLQVLKIHHCSKLVCESEMVLPTSLQRLSVRNSGELDKSFHVGCLENLASLTVLHLQGCRHLESILLNSINTKDLKGLALQDCSELSSIGGWHHALSSIKHVIIYRCPKFTEVEQPFRMTASWTGEDKKLLFEFSIYWNRIMLRRWNWVPRLSTLAASE